MIAHPLPSPGWGDRVCFMGNTGEGKTVVACSLLRSRPNVIVVNTKRSAIFRSVGEKVVGNAIYDVGEGRYDWHPGDEFSDGANAEALQNQFFKWCLDNGNRDIYIDEYGDICKTAQTYPIWLARCIKRGREDGLSIWGSAQEPVAVPRFCFGQCQHRYLFFLGWDPHRKAAEAWFQQAIDWDAIPERSHAFFIKTPSGLYGPQPPLADDYVRYLERFAA